MKHNHEVDKVEITYCRADCKCGAFHSITVWQNDKGYNWELNEGDWNEPLPSLKETKQ